jgi:hypothetical protein
MPGRSVPQGGAKRVRPTRMKSPALLFIQHSKFPLLLGVLGVLAVNTSSFAATTWSQTWNVSTVIPDNDEVGFTDTRMVTIPAVTEIESLSVNLNFTGGRNGDLYAYLVHGDGFAVLLNRPGEESTLQSWSLSITAVPEPSSALLGVMGAVLLLRRKR